MMPLDKIYKEGMAIWKQHVITAAGIIFAGGIAWATLNNQVEDNIVLAGENKEKIENMDEELDTIQRKQDVLDLKLENEISRQDEYREETKEDLQRILNKLDRNNDNSGTNR